MVYRGSKNFKNIFPKIFAASYRNYFFGRIWPKTRNKVNFYIFSPKIPKVHILIWLDQLKLVPSSHKIACPSQSDHDDAEEDDLPTEYTYPPLGDEMSGLAPPRKTGLSTPPERRRSTFLSELRKLCGVAGQLLLFWWGKTLFVGVGTLIWTTNLVDGPTLCAGPFGSKVAAASVTCMSTCKNCRVITWS